MVAAVGQLYATERTAGQDIQRLDFMIFSILLAYVSVATGWFINSRDHIPSFVYGVVPLPAIGLVAYLVQLMDLSKARSNSIDYLEERLRAYAQVPEAPPIGSAAEKSVTDIGAMTGFTVTRVLRVALSSVLYLVAIIGSYFWMVTCLILSTMGSGPAVPQLASFFAMIGVLGFFTSALLMIAVAVNIGRVLRMYAKAA